MVRSFTYVPLFSFYLNIFILVTQNNTMTLVPSDVTVFPDEEICLTRSGR